MNNCYIEDKLEKHGLRKTKDRYAILELFEQDRAWTAAQVHNELGNMNLSTVYRNMQKLVEAEILTELVSRNQERLFERVSQTHHDHVFCSDCGIVECTPCPITNLPEHNLELMQKCSSCS